MRDTVFTDFNEQKATLWGEHILPLKHNLHERPTFTDDGLATLLDSIPEDRIAINTMGPKGDDVSTWSYCQRGDLSGAQLVDAVAQGRIWINLTKINETAAEFRDLLDEMFESIGAHVPNLNVYRNSMGLLISSPNAQVFYHADVPGQSLWQIRGEKRIYVYPNRPPFLHARDLEGIIRGLTEEEIGYEPWFDEYATVADLKPGDMLHWPLNGPHRVENKDCLNVSLTTEHWTPEIRRHFAVHYGNSVLRSFGWTPKSTDLYGPNAWAKFGLTAFWRLSGMQKRQGFKRKERFKLDMSAPDLLVPLRTSDGVA